MTGPLERPVGRFSLPKLAGAIEWESIALLRSIGILKVGYLGVILTPILAYLIVTWNELTVAMPALHVNLPWAFFLTFLGSTFLATGHLINEIACPKLIKIHGNLRNYQKYVGEFVMSEHAIFQAGESAERLIAIHEAKEYLPDLPDEILDKLGSAVARQVLESDQQPEASDAIVTTYRETWEAESKRFLFARVVIVSCYLLAGFIAITLAIRQLRFVLWAALA